MSLNTLFEPALIQALPDGEFWIYAAGSSLIAGFALYRGLKAIARARLIENTPTAKIRSAPQGIVELVGNCRPAPAGVLTSPLSRTPCVWFRYSVERRNDKKWQRVKGGSSKQLFLCDDGTGLCAIYPLGAKITISDPQTWYGSTDNALPDHAHTSGRYRYSEELLQEGDSLYAHGLFVSLDDAVADGRADNPVLKDESPQNEELEVFHTLSKPRSSNAPYLLSNRPQDKIISRARNAGRFGIILFFIAGAIAVRLFVAKFL